MAKGDLWDKTFKCPITNKIVVFNTHEELDEYVMSIAKGEERVEELKEKHLGDFQLLKAFDRAFWLQYLSVRDKPLVGDAETVQRIRKQQKDSCPLRNDCMQCPFGDPTETSFTSL